MESRIGKDWGPFSEVDDEYMIYRVALGVDWLNWEWIGCTSIWL